MTKGDMVMTEKIGTPLFDEFVYFKTPRRDHRPGRD
jgi:hypothetical protein